ncbi:uncharacterized protein LOC122381827 isoform X2 [Amphibalanus amphitrite]|nr:uncharacterized protein LOC122381827 isoform X2 [Amphibalanus amphitrite]XP_043222475.1 uncharacterized protein LOC122381827 isoform X2 [Amphibalanus amphitrite]
MLPLSCMSIKPVECFPNQNGKSSLHCSFQPRPWSPVTLLAVESEASIRSALLFQAAVTLAAAGDSVLYITSAPLQTLPPTVHGMPLPASESMHRVRFIYLPTAEAVLGYLASLHISVTSGGRYPDAILLDAPAVTAPSPSAAGRTPPAAGRTPPAAAESPLATLARLRAALEDAALTAAAATGGRCAALMVSQPAGARPGRPVDRRTARLVPTGPDTLQLICGPVTAHMEVTPHCVRLRSVAVTP